MRVLAICLTIALLSGCESTTQTASESKLVTYQVPVEYSHDIMSTLSSTFAGQHSQVKLGWSKNSGRILILAESELHKTIAKFINEYLKNPPSPDKTIMTHLWIVPASISSNDQSADYPKTLREPLQAITDKYGYLKLGAIQSFTGMTKSNGSWGSYSENTIIEYQLRFNNQHIIGDVSLNRIDVDLSLKSEISIKSGEIIVLGNIPNNTKSNPEFPIYLFIMQAQIN